jgi:archaellum component FlaF (FlaF/FlaG flagellin family)
MQYHPSYPQYHQHAPAHLYVPVTATAMGSLSPQVGARKIIPDGTLLPLLSSRSYYLPLYFDMSVCVYCVCVCCVCVWCVLYSDGRLSFIQ